MKSPARIVYLRTEILKLGFPSKKCGFYSFDRIVSDSTELRCWVICSSINTGHMFATRSAVCLFWLYYLTTHHNKSQGTEFVLYDAAQAWSNHWTNPGLLAVTWKLAASQPEQDIYWNHKITVKIVMGAKWQDLLTHGLLSQQLKKKKIRKPIMHFSHDSWPSTRKNILRPRIQIRRSNYYREFRYFKSQFH